MSCWVSGNRFSPLKIERGQVVVNLRGHHTAKSQEKPYLYKVLLWMWSQSSQTPCKEGRSPGLGPSLALPQGPRAPFPCRSPALAEPRRRRLAVPRVPFHWGAEPWWGLPRAPRPAWAPLSSIPREGGAGTPTPGPRPSHHPLSIPRRGPAASSFAGSAGDGSSSPAAEVLLPALTADPSPSSRPVCFFENTQLQASGPCFLFSPARPGRGRPARGQGGPSRGSTWSRAEVGRPGPLPLLWAAC